MDRLGVENGASRADAGEFLPACAPPRRVGFVHPSYLLHPFRLYPIRDRLRHNVVRR